jgi:hypothetical protein
MEQRKNTVKVQLQGYCEKPLDLEVIGWMVRDLELKAEDIYGVAQNPSNDGVIFIKTFTEDMMYEIIRKYNGTMFKYSNGSAVRVEMTVATENSRYVRIFGLPFEADDQYIHGFFGQFGTVKRVVREKFPSHCNFDSYSGVRGVHIDLRKDVPPFLYMKGYRVKIHYYGMKEKCHICGSPDHMKNECPKKPMSIGTPATRLEAMTNLNTLFKKPGPVFPTLSYAETAAGLSSIASRAGGQAVAPPEEQQVLQVPVAPLEKQQFVVTIADDAEVDISLPLLSETTKSGDKSLLSVPSQDAEKMDESGWQRVQRRSRSRSDETASSMRARTESDSSASSTVSRSRGRPKKRQMVIETIADREKQKQIESFDSKKSSAEISDANDMTD